MNYIADITNYLETINYADDTLFIADVDNIPKNELKIVIFCLKRNKLSCNL